MPEIVNSSNIETPNARRVILNLLRVAEGGVLSAAEAIAACALFGISGNSVRVTLARLSQARLVEAAGRGLYRLGPAGRAIAADIAGWRGVEERLVPWDGCCGGLDGRPPRSDRKLLRARNRALSMLGMRELDNGLFVRPDNFVGGVDAVRQRLDGLGLERGAAVFRADGFDGARQKRAMRLWDTAALIESYRRETARLEAWAGRADGLPLDVAARDSFVLGGSGIRRIVFDPMLPAPLVAEAERRAFIDAVICFDDLGRRIWTRFLGTVQNGS